MGLFSNHIIFLQNTFTPSDHLKPYSDINTIHQIENGKNSTNQENIMKTIAIKTTFIFILSCVMMGSVQAQLLNRITDRVQQTAENKVLNKAETETEQAMDKAEESVKGGKDKKKSAKDKSTQDATESSKNSTSGSASLISYSNYDFVPGDKIIYHYDMAGERDSEIPGRMLIDEGNAEIQTYRGEKVLFVPANSQVYFSPQMKEKAYLPEQFTLEFDVLSNGGISTTLDVSEITLYFREKDESSGAYGGATAPIRISLSGLSGDASGTHYEFGVFKNDDWSGGGSKNFPTEAVNSTQNNWRRVAVYVNKNIGKLYIDQHRIGISNQIESGKPAFLDIEVNTPENPVMFKNFRIAAGGADAYNKVVTDGKFIAYGIQFDVNKATLKPESMGTINEFVKMMKENADLKFEIGGHTDSDGTTELNNKLSQERADAVKTQMTNMGIEASRLTTKGFGPQNPIAKNDTAENKARNRRVEFLKI